MPAPVDCAASPPQAPSGAVRCRDLPHDRGRAGLATTRRALVWGLVHLAAAAFGWPAGATHAPDHRFIVVGVVKDPAGRPLADVPVVVTRLRTGLDYPTRTARDGVYLVVVHLHDEDEGDRLTVSSGDVTGEVVARFDRRDHRVERGTRVDIGPQGISEDRRAFPEALRAYLAR